MIERRAFLKAGLALSMTGLCGTALGRDNGLSEACQCVMGLDQPDDWSDVKGPFPSDVPLLGKDEALKEEERCAREILDQAPKGAPLLETAQYFEKLQACNKSGHPYNAQWPVRWNPVIVNFYHATDLPVRAPIWTYQEGDTIDWCAAFINWCLARGGYKFTYSTMSGSFRLKGGLGTPTDRPEPGDIIVFRKKDNEKAKAGFGHVGIYIAATSNGYKVLGGNQKAGKHYTSVNTTVLPGDSDLEFDSFRSFKTIGKAQI